MIIFHSSSSSSFFFFFFLFFFFFIIIQIDSAIVSSFQVTSPLGGQIYYSNGIGTNAIFSTLLGLTISSDNSFILITDNSYLIRKVLLSNNLVSTIAGQSFISGITDGIGTNSLFHNPYDINLSNDMSYALIVEYNQYLIRKFVLSTNAVTTIAGQAYVSTSVDGIGTSATIKAPICIAIDKTGTFALIIDSGNYKIRQMVISTLAITTLTGSTYGLVDGVGTNVKFKNPRYLSISPDSTYALITDTMNNHIIRKLVISTATVTSILGGTTSGNANGIGTNALFNNPTGVNISPDGNYAIVSDTSNSLIRLVDLSTLSVSTLAGSTIIAGNVNGVGTNALFYGPLSSTYSSDGTYILILDQGNLKVRKLIISTTVVTTIAGRDMSDYAVGTNVIFGRPTRIAYSPDYSYALMTDGSFNTIRKIILSTYETSLFAGRVMLGTSNGFGTNALFSYPYGIKISTDNTFALVVENMGQRLRKIVISTIEVTSIAGNTYSGLTNGIGTNALFMNPTGVAISIDNTFALVVDSYGPIRYVDLSTAQVSVLAGVFPPIGVTDGIGTNAAIGASYDIAISPDGTYALVVDNMNNLLRKVVITTALVTTLAGSTSGYANGIGTNAQFSAFYGVCFSPDGTSAILTTFSTIRRIILSTLAVSDIAGSSSTGSTNGYGTNALFSTVYGVAVSNYGMSALVTDGGNMLVRYISLDGTYPPTLTPTRNPTRSPTSLPSVLPTYSPSSLPTINPTLKPSVSPTTIPPSSTPTINPTFYPSTNPTLSPTYLPSVVPTIIPSNLPSVDPTLKPSFTPTINPTFYPSTNPTLSPTYSPTSIPSSIPSEFPTTYKSLKGSSNNNNKKKRTTKLIIYIIPIIVGSILICVCFWYGFKYHSKVSRTKLHIQVSSKE